MDMQDFFTKFKATQHLWFSSQPCICEEVFAVWLLSQWQTVWCTAVNLLPLFPPKADPKRRRLSLVENDGWKRHAGEPEYATQEEAQKISVSQQSESGGKESYWASIHGSANIYCSAHFELIVFLLSAFTSSNGYGRWQFLESPEELHLWPLLWSFPE